MQIEDGSDTHGTSHVFGPCDPVTTLGQREFSRNGFGQGPPHHMSEVRFIIISGQASNMQLDRTNDQLETKLRAPSKWQLLNNKLLEQNVSEHHLRFYKWRRRCLATTKSFGTTPGAHSAEPLCARPTVGLTSAPRSGRQSSQEPPVRTAGSHRLQMATLSQEKRPQNDAGSNLVQQTRNKAAFTRESVSYMQSSPNATSVTESHERSVKENTRGDPKTAKQFKKNRATWTCCSSWTSITLHNASAAVNSNFLLRTAARVRTKNPRGYSGSCQGTLATESLIF